MVGGAAVQPFPSTKEITMTHKEILEELREPVRVLTGHIPDVFEGYRKMRASAFADGALDAKTKELIALAISVTKQCDGCIASHARGAARRRATAEEVAQALGVAIALSGGPGTVHAPRAYAAFEEFASKQ
jgi:AhpD family alkylhydroperoxidase